MSRLFLPSETGGKLLLVLCVVGGDNEAAELIETDKVCGLVKISGGGAGGGGGIGDDPGVIGGLGAGGLAGGGLRRVGGDELDSGGETLGESQSGRSGSDLPKVEGAGVAARSEVGSPFWKLFSIFTFGLTTRLRRGICVLNVSWGPSFRDEIFAEEIEF
ncbi:hypothetical protein WR25_17747 [Diploscapter pachys]|uniref:Uncharacterized protein n=1 Tax=Diploscapter pachys TaxID=2018661 RepID=A0A2A2LPJ5_9BILA|nr:hypothetical protein WR25_17747 [Diploscapter pachys]